MYGRAVRREPCQAPKSSCAGGSGSNPLAAGGSAPNPPSTNGSSVWGGGRAEWKAGGADGSPRFVQDARDRLGRRDGRDDLHAASAPTAFENVVQEHSPYQRRPWHSPRRVFARAGLGPGGRAQGRRGGGSLGGTRHNPRPGREGGRQHSKVPGQVCSRARHDRDKALDDLVWREHERRRAISPGSLEPQLEAAVVELGQPLGGDGRARQVASHALEPLAIVCPNARCGLEVVSFDLRAQLPHHERVDVCWCAANADDPAASARAGRDNAPRRRLGDRGQDGRALNEASLRGIGLAIGEHAFDPAEDRGHDARHVLVGRCRGRMEHRLATRRKAVCAVQEEGVVVNAQIDRRVEALDHRHRAGLERAADLPAVQRILRHSDPRLTTETYGHLVPDYLRAQIDRLSFGPMAPSHAPADSREAQAVATIPPPFAPILLPEAENPGKAPSPPDLETQSSRGLESGRGERIRTSDILLPKQARYQAAPRPEKGLILHAPARAALQNYPRCGPDHRHAYLGSGFENSAWCWLSSSARRVLARVDR